MKRERRHYDKEFKRMASELVESGRSSKDVADDLGINVDLVRRWRRERKHYQSGSFPGKGNMNMTPEQKEISDLKKANLSLRQRGSVCLP